jgi:hypothetical protein
MATTRTGPRDTTRAMDRAYKALLAIAGVLASREGEGGRAEWSPEVQEIARAISLSAIRLSDRQEAEGGALAGAYGYLKECVAILDLIDARETKRQKPRKPRKRPATKKAAR